MTRIHHLCSPSIILMPDASIIHHGLSRFKPTTLQRQSTIYHPRSVRTTANKIGPPDLAFLARSLSPCIGILVIKECCGRTHAKHVDKLWLRTLGDVLICYP